jgi:hypothetical protein
LNEVSLLGLAMVGLVRRSVGRKNANKRRLIKVDRQLCLNVLCDDNQAEGKIQIQILVLR